ncbi:heme-binding domain-containing protein [Chryseobacterium chendengshani]|uniref:heme-binding domain-containing protein n=1 Tax=Chryseobacterium sp. LJ668 TaxID=2864040 RepID=UPI001C688D1D|nr:heme-binding domain-containing protein [Chryseobacterium sp. LJ668]MBW8522359.1 heme-binding domain-containing protein [Chryseobacterium sp. LJ668]QYK17998.1 heme-binding domain-containing protein [Chryseobacterium sp. LJ668]
MKTFKKIIFWVLVSFALIQFVPTDKTNKPIDKKVNFIDVKKSPPKVVTLLKNACYDCHSNETVYPKYAYIAPFSWSVKDHVNEGREHLNFSLWNSYNKDLKESMLTKTVQTLENKSMPLPAYIIYHEDANLTDVERGVLSNYFKEILKSKSY